MLPSWRRGQRPAPGHSPHRHRCQLDERGGHSSVFFHGAVGPSERRRNRREGELVRRGFWATTVAMVCGALAFVASVEGAPKQPDVQIEVLAPMTAGPAATAATN